MRSERLSFAAGARSRPELVLTVRALAGALAAEGVVATVVNGGDGGDAISILRMSEERSEEIGLLTLADDGLSVEMRTPDRSTEVLPLLVPPIEERPAASILIRGGPADRRLRMAARVLEELRRRSPRLRRVGWLDFPDEIVRARTLDEIHPALDAAELARLLGGIVAAFDAAPDPELRTSLGELAIAAGLPLVTHEGSGLAAADRVRVVSEWSDEILAEAIAEAAKEGRGPRRDAYPAMVRLSGALQL